MNHDQSASPSSQSPSPLSADQAWRWIELWERAGDGVITKDERAQLEHAVQNDPAVRALLAQNAWLGGALRSDPALQEAAMPHAHAGEHGHGSALPVRESRITWRWPHAVAAAAAALLASGVTLWGWRAATTQPVVATLEKAHLCKWGNSALPTLEGSQLRPGMLELVEGMATLRFASGAEVVMEAPVSLEVVSAMECRVKNGTVVADVPHTAKGFTIQTPDTRVVDFGTRFGVSTSDDGKCLVHVIEGDVQVNRSKDGESRHLKTGERVDYGGWVQSRVNPGVSADDQPEPDRWLPAPIGEGRDGWQMLTTAFGRGRDTCIQSNASTQITGREPFFRVKHTTLDAKLERKGYVAFDISRFRGRQIEAAEFILHLEPSDLGFASLVPDATFTVYGLTDETQDTWTEDGLNWTAAPAHTGQPEHHAIPVSSQTEALGQFTVPQGSSRGAFSISGPALADFLRRDTNGLVTFIVIRNTDETARNGLVHAFATKENPRNTPPMLRLKVAGE